MNRLALPALVLLAGCSSSTAAPTPTPTPVLPRLQVAATACGITAPIQDKGASISFDTKGKKDATGDELTAVTCLLSKTDAPDYVLEHINSTRALDGNQTDEWNGYKARWTYHPDSGLRITFIDSRL